MPSRIQYSKHATCTYLEYEPDQSRDTEVAICLIHGGAWCMGHPNWMERIGVNLAARGYHTYSIGYRLSSISSELTIMVIALGMLASISLSIIGSQKVRASVAVTVGAAVIVNLLREWQADHHLYPTHVKDVSAALHHIHSRRNHRRLLLCGHSAGGHLASMIACQPKWRTGLPVVANITIGAVFSSARLMRLSTGKRLVFNAFGRRNDYSECFPVNCVTSNTLPHLIINASHDYTLIRHSLDMLDTLYSSGVPVYSVIVRSTHSDLIAADHEHVCLMIDNYITMLLCSTA